MTGASIGGFLGFKDAHLDGKDGRPSRHQNSMPRTWRRNGVFRADGPVNLGLARIGGMLTFRGAHPNGKDKGAAPPSSRTWCDGSHLCDQGFRTDGPVDLGLARIGTGLSFTGAHLNSYGGVALIGTRLTVTGDMSCNGVTTVGGINLTGASIGGSLGFLDAHLDGKDGEALSGIMVNLVSEVCTRACNGVFRADGPVKLNYARIGMALIFSGAHLNGKHQDALFAPGLSVTGVMLCNSMSVDGRICLRTLKSVN